ncbi:MAG: hypothetical protein ACYC28_13400 [Longimicrobiales bacterium]
MTRRWVNRIGALALAVFIVVGTSSCSQDVIAPEPQPTPTETELLGLGGLLNGLLGGGPSQIGEYTKLDHFSRYCLAAN